MKKKVDIFTKIAERFKVKVSAVYLPLGISSQRHFLWKTGKNMIFEWDPDKVEKVAKSIGVSAQELNVFLSKHYFG